MLSSLQNNNCRFLYPGDEDDNEDCKIDELDVDDSNNNDENFWILSKYSVGSNNNDSDEATVDDSAVDLDNGDNEFSGDTAFMIEHIFT